MLYTMPGNIYVSIHVLLYRTAGGEFTAEGQGGFDISNTDPVGEACVVALPGVSQHTLYCNNFDMV
jgi:hypothetical protein